MCFLVMEIYWEQVGILKMGVCFLRRWGVFFMLGNVEARVSGCLWMVELGSLKRSLARLKGLLLFWAIRCLLRFRLPFG
ncbi:hypothetical protein [Kingella sp. (in: b-proteobacteria)]|uniref:hypothetical protein n=1 Tax=Kingella sp. (in: b-proteobacteria) TaxID=2020713 RepID=UPI0026DBAA19|nr:hypothetical protein [Kingella sp. (in: b-proteobacteria)]MDO4657489.1 hypothetical protein [Kingella sp. (in: b-proteobacteria)]